MPSHKLLGIAMVAIATLSATACKRASPAEAPPHGRYVGVGIYGPEKQWTRMVAAQKTGSETAAKMIDDQVIIVVSDTETGELRACGDMTGYCIGLNPWRQTLAKSQMAPIDLTDHVQPEDPNMTIEVAPSPRRPKRHPYKPAAKPHAPRAAAPAES